MPIVFKLYRMVNSNMYYCLLTDDGELDINIPYMYICYRYAQVFNIQHSKIFTLIIIEF